MRHTPETIHEALKETDGNVGATLLFPQDTYGYVVVKASKSGKVLTAIRLETPSLTTGHKPARFDGPWPVWEHFYTDEELRTMRLEGNEIRLTWSEKGNRYRHAGTSFVVGAARYYRNYSY